MTEVKTAPPPPDTENRADQSGAKPEDGDADKDATEQHPYRDRARRAREATRETRKTLAEKIKKFVSGGENDPSLKDKIKGKIAEYWDNANDSLEDRYFDITDAAASMREEAGEHARQSGEKVIKRTKESAKKSKDSVAALGKSTVRYFRDSGVNMVHQVQANHDQQRSYFYDNKAYQMNLKAQWKEDKMAKMVNRQDKAEKKGKTERAGRYGERAIKLKNQAEGMRKTADKKRETANDRRANAARLRTAKG